MDIGCGIGTWLSIAKKLGIEDVLGVDGDYVNHELLSKYLSQSEFKSHDLTLPLVLGRKFDFCLCLEVAEHLPEKFSDVLVDTLVRHSDLILFSAAIPGQGGQNHINEQEPNFWIKKFETKGYYVYDPIRPLVWTNYEVDVWYKQNIFLFSKNPMDLLKPIFTHLVHPELYQVQVQKKIQYESELEMIKSGKARPGFYLKRFFKSLLQ
ncbi:methyltransferase family protein [Algoriphagus aquaeductus]|uniref:Methyltransferase family protein n=1 Tax=Algoriphagus aquaeductus TaxID=475299 RepID=A0A326RIU6_9BACT|nr:methyltransferase family protein [Algoriphagus aquaeductus]